MTRTKAMLWGAVFGGGIGPLFGGTLLVALDMLASKNTSLTQTRIFLPLFCLIFCGIPGVVLGFLSGNVVASSPRWRRMLIGIGLAFATSLLGAFVLDGFPRISETVSVAKSIWTEASTEPALVVIVAISGMACGWVFPTRPAQP